MKRAEFALAALLVILISTAVIFTSAPASFAAKPEDVFVVKDMDWYTKAGEEAPEPRGSIKTNNGRYYWLVINPDIQDESNGLELGILFYLEKTNQYSFLPLVDDSVCDVHFSPDGSMFIIEGAGEFAMYDIGIELFRFDGFTSIFKTIKAATPPQWVDVGCFVYSRYEPNTSRNRPDDYPDEWMSLAMYDTLAGEETVLKAATETSDFTFNEIVEGGVSVLEGYVKSPGDWEDPEKYETRELTVELPAGNQRDMGEKLFP